MKKVYRYSKINNDFMGKSGPYNRTPNDNEIKTAIKEKKLICDDGLIIFGEPTYIEVRMLVNNQFKVNRYNDVYGL